MGKYNQEIGKQGEDAVTQDLEERGFEIVQRNIYTRYGELDIIAVRENILHIIEVKTRKNDAFGGAVNALSRTKFLKMQKAAVVWMEEQQMSYNHRQFDFAAVTLDLEIQIEWFWNIGMDDMRYY